MSGPQDDYTPDPLLDEEVNDAIQRNDTSVIWGMVDTLAAMDTRVWAVNREAIRRSFNGHMKIGLLDQAIREKQKKVKLETVVKSSEKVLEPWEELLHQSKNGNFKAVLINADVAIRNYPEWQGVLAYDEFKQKVRAVKQPPIGGVFPRDWNDTDDTNAAVWLQSKGIYVGQSIAGSVIQSISRDTQIHCVRDYLHSLTWDGTPRIDNWLSTFLGAENNPTTRMIGSRWLISAIARIMNPGCQCDYMMVLEGPQGIKKSTALKILASQDWFCDHSPELHDKDSQMQLFGNWIIEWAELDSLRKSDVTAVKQFLSRRVEKFRPPYGKHVIDAPRQCVFAGTTNETEWNKDETGARRFWPVTCQQVDSDNLEKFRDQIWAEAMTRYLDGSIWWPETIAEHELLEIEQNARMEPDPWQPSIAKYLDEHKNERLSDEITASELLSKCIGLPLSEHDLGKKKRIGRVMRAIGWVYVQERIPNTKNHFSGYKLKP